MEIVESWQDLKDNWYAIVRYSQKVQREGNCKGYEVLWWDEYAEELCSFAGCPGFRIADFDTLEEAQKFLLTGIAHSEDNPDFWFEMLKV